MLCFFFRATDGLYEVNVTMTIQVTDEIDESPVITAYSTIILPEEIPVGTRVSWAVNVTDDDKDDVLQYSMTGKKVVSAP